MWLLALDTSTPQTALALGRIEKARGTAERVAVATHDDAGRPASALLGPRIEALLAEAGIAARAVGAVACGRGPGMFTGSRVALATAKGLALGLQCPLFGLSTLAALAGSGRAHVLSLLDARRGEVYAARFVVGDDGPARRAEDRCCPLEHALSDMSEETLSQVQVVGPAALVQALPEGLRARALAVTGVDGPGLWLAAARAALREVPDDVAAIDAVYLRASYAELGLNTPKRPPFRSPFA
jgi:tRNA threonylcarbamoyl adenosine modification protein YeaZ